MTSWTRDELDRIAAADELRIASMRRDGSLRVPVIVWVVRHGEDLYVRAVGGRAAGWFRGTQDRHEGRIRAGGVERDVRFVDAGDDAHDAIDAAYRTKYRSYGARFVDSVVSAQARSATIRLVPRAAG